MTTFTRRNATNAAYPLFMKKLKSSLTWLRNIRTMENIKNPIIENTIPMARFRRKEKKGLVGGLTDALTAVWLRVLISIRPPLLVIPKPLL
jgi:hypothetical protein